MNSDKTVDLFTCPDCGMDMRSIADELADRLTHGFTVVAADDLRSRVQPDIEAVAEYFASLEVQESNRAIPVLAFSYIEEQLRTEIAQNLEPLDNGLERELFDYRGPLGTARSQITVARALGWLSEQTTSELHRLRKIRNHFSHSPKAQFDDDMVVDHLKAHSQAEVVRAMMGDVDPEEIYMDRVGRNILESRAFDARLRFVIAAFITTRRSMMELALFPILNRWGVVPAAAGGGDAHPLNSALSGWTDGIVAGLESIVDASEQRLTLVEGGPAIDSSVGRFPNGDAG